MKYVDEFRDGALARKVAAAIAAEARPSRRYNLMEFCGGHTHAISRYGLADLLPPGIRMIHGPGCPVCVLPIGRIDNAIALAARPGLILCTYADTMRVPASKGLSLLKAKARGADIRMVYSSADAVRIAQEHPDREVVFFAIGFETTAPANVMSVLQAKAMGLRNYSVLVSHVCVPPAMHAILGSPHNRVQAFLAAGHVCTVMGYWEYEPIARRYQVPIVVTGFEPLDLVQGIRQAVEQLENGRADVENAYSRVVTREGNPAAQQVIAQVLEVCDRNWRGIGRIPASGWKLRPEFAEFDAELRFEVQGLRSEESPLCIAGQILQGLRRPGDCSAFGQACTPEHPLGATMVSSEGACAAYYRYGRSSGRAGAEDPRGTSEMKDRL